MQILLADDSKITALPLSAYLERQGHAVTYVENGRAAVEAYRQSPPDLVLMDVMMPEMDGIEATRRIKALGGARWVPVLLITSLSDQGEIIKGLDAGADDYLVKPLVAELLDARIRSMQRIASMQDSLFGILNNVNDAIVTIDEAGKIRSYNIAAERIFGYGATEVIGANVSMLMPSPYTEEHDGYLARYLRERTPHIIGIGRKLPGRRKNGESFSMLLSVTEVQTGQGYQFIGVVRDISEKEMARKKAMSSAHIIAQRGRFIQTVTDAMPGLISHWDKDLRCSFANKSYLEWFGKSPQEILGATMQDVLGESLFALNEPYVRGVMSGQRQQFEQTLTKADGSVRHTLAYYIPDFDTDGTVAGFFVLVTDVTALKEVERLKEGFVSAVSHELRTPLTSIRGALGLVLGMFAKDFPDNVQQLLENANRNSERLTLLINDILDIEKLSAGKLQFHMEVQALMPLVEEALAANYGYGVEHRVQFVLVERADGVKVRVDSQRLAQVLSNLLSNAAKFSSRPPETAAGTGTLMTNAGTSTLETNAGTSQAIVEIGVHQMDGQVRVSVRDFGLGVPDNFRTHIFKKFSQADSSNSQRKGGTGLGLAITKELIEHMGGTVGFDSREGKGATFFFELPVCDPAQ
ncbi:MAG: PAS domain S-box protein [Sterolibacterium sp.]|nr:PAS domain S-box protein [Sterolibacterium sp.]